MEATPISREVVSTGESAEASTKKAMEASTEDSTKFMEGSVCPPGGNLSTSSENTWMEVEFTSFVEAFVYFQENKEGCEIRRLIRLLY